MSCRVARTREWTVRLYHELDEWDSAVFVTLTYDDVTLPDGGTLVKRDSQLFLKRLRKNSGRKCVYYLAGEYGDKFGRPHYHLILFGFGLQDREEIEAAWPLGLVHLGTVTHDSIQYVCGYVQKKLSGPKAEEVYKGKLPPFALMSKKLGLRYCQRNAAKIVETLDITMNGQHVGIPRYYKKQLGLDHSQLAEKAIASENAVKAHYSTKGIVGELDQALAVYKARRQADLNINAKIALKESKL